MTISMQNLQDVLIALLVVERGKTRASRAIHAVAPAQHPTQTDDARELVLR